MHLLTSWLFWTLVSTLVWAQAQPTLVPAASLVSRIARIEDREAIKDLFARYGTTVGTLHRFGWRDGCLGLFCCLLMMLMVLLQHTHAHTHKHTHKHARAIASTTRRCVLNSSSWLLAFLLYLLTHARITTTLTHSRTNTQHNTHNTTHTHTPPNTHARRPPHNRYCASVDRKDWKTYRSVFTHDAHIDYTAAGGNRGNVDEIVLWMAHVFRFMARQQHSVSNFEITLVYGAEKVDSSGAGGGSDGVDGAGAVGGRGDSHAGGHAVAAEVRVMFDNPFSLPGVNWPLFRVGGWYVAELRRDAEEAEGATAGRGAGTRYSGWKIRRLSEDIAYNTVYYAVATILLLGAMLSRWCMARCRGRGKGSSAAAAKTGSHKD